ncbi:MAG: SpoIIE family protein phosphatase [Clostridia bacterium]|nr:SpoIIE family protein phosphatase [Clostridia bacterium]
MKEMTESLKETLKRFLFRGIRFKMTLAVLAASVLMLTAVGITMDRTVSNTVEELISSRMESDIKYIEDLFDEGEWNIRDGALYRGDILVGDGTVENAYLAPFLEMEQKTGSFSYTFVKTSDNGLDWVGDKKTGYMQGHFMRVAGSTLSPDGKKIMGTYMDKKVADILDEKGVYSGQANVVGGMVFCLYRTITDSSGEVVGVICVGRSIESMREQTKKAERSLITIVIAAMLFVAVGLDVLVFTWISKLDTVNNYLRDISSGTFPEEPLNLHTNDELIVTAACINEMTEALKERERISGELSIATNIQAHMLPCIFPPFPDHDEFDIYATMTPAKEVGGDFYDFFMIDEKHLAVVIADVSGKGVPAALFMVIAKTLIKNYAQMGMDPCNVFTKVNQLLCEGNEAGLFVTAWMGVLNLETGKLTYVNAGHNPPMIKLADGGFTFLRSRPGFVLAGLDTVRYKQNELVMAPGDKLFLYTDGVTEATDKDNQLYGEQRLGDYLCSHIGDDVKELLTGLKDDIDAFAGEAEQFDDITMLVLDYRQKRASDDAAEKAFPASLDALSDVLAFTEAELNKADCSPKAAMQIAVAAEEIFVNIAHYAYPGESGKMKLGITVDNGVARLNFRDYGVPFNPLKKADPDITLDADSRQIGGLGIFMVKKTMDEVRYERKGAQNVLTIKKKIN